MNKFFNKKPIIDGIEFDSIKESKRYIQLKHLEETGEITHLRLQPKFTYYSENIKTKKGQPIVLFNYYADFEYCTDSGEYIVEDVKSEYTKKLPVYRLKKKLIEDRFKFEIKEI